MSHNLAAISSLCSKGLLLINGKLNIEDKIELVLKNYSLQTQIGNNNFENKSNHLKEGISSIKILNENQCTVFSFNSPIEILISANHPAKIKGTSLGIAIKDKWQQKIFTDTFEIPETEIMKAKSLIKIIIPSKFLLSGFYFIDVAIFLKNQQPFEYLSEVCSFQIEDLESELSSYSQSNVGSVYIKCDWNVI